MNGTASRELSLSCKRRSVQFSLRTLLLAMAACSIAVLFANAVKVRARHQKQAVTAITKLGGAIQYDYLARQSKPPAPKWLRQALGDEYFCNVVSISLTGPLVTDVALRRLAPHLKALPAVRKVSLMQCPVTANGLKCLANLQNLEEINISQTQVADTGLAYLSRFPKLRSVSLWCPPAPPLGSRDADTALYSAETIRHLKRLKGLETLSISFGYVDDEGAMRIRDLTELKSLRIECLYSLVSDEGLAHLGDLNCLVELTLHSPYITDNGLQNLTSLTRLRGLDLAGSPITDAGVMHLKELANLERLNLQDTRITDAAVEHLAKMANLTTVVLSRPYKAESPEFERFRQELLAEMKRCGRVVAEAGITDEGLNRLSAALPGTRIVRP